MNPTRVDVCLDVEQNCYCALHFAAHFNRPDVVKKLLIEMKAGTKHPRLLFI